jgi:hypothetical protein
MNLDLFLHLILQARRGDHWQLLTDEITCQSQEAKIYNGGLIGDLCFLVFKKISSPQSNKNNSVFYYGLVKVGSSMAFKYDSFLISTCIRGTNAQIF